ncbi:MAG: radical SAM protein [Humidesulfovibrio sp.]|uniref:radical SAM protein n=1 Tax=Humidesulfovibrio sp. TaxID=2910988 RepID=UPI0027FDB03F|nr:radical SAM protein [Humidesulfovibrio sp.]MDQ7834593.1 radical SAM protein [Humidesulfovibrio sp.]
MRRPSGAEEKRQRRRPPATRPGKSMPAPPDHGGRLPAALVIPGDEGLGLSALGWQAVYRLLAARPEIAVERFFLGKGFDAPVSADSQRDLRLFPLMAASVSFEEDFLPFLRALAAAGVPSTRTERPDYPLVLVGGPIAFLNPAPLAPLADAFFVGEAEAGLVDFCLKLKEAVFDGVSKQDFLHSVKDMPGIYVPGLSKTPVRRVLDISPGDCGLLGAPASSCFTGPQAAFPDALLLEVNRGCPHACRFCAAGFVYRPPRHASIESLQALVQEADPPKVGLVGTALTDWPDLLAFLRWLHARKTKFSLSSLRADGLTEELLGFLRECGIRTVTLALEGASERLRHAANKKLDAEVFLAAVERAARLGVNHLRVYLILGWPWEGPEDYDELEGFLARICEARDRGHGRKTKEFMRITLGASSLVPKPWTPMQWAGMASEETLLAAQKRLKDMTRHLRGVALQVDAPFQARLQGVLSRGGEEAFELVQLAASEGGWKKAMRLWADQAANILDRQRGEDEAFPWEVIDTGVSRASLWREWTRAGRALHTPGCPKGGCEACGLCGMDKWLKS